jgi:hypothetical protein
LGYQWGWAYIVLGFGFGFGLRSASGSGFGLDAPMTRESKAPEGLSSFFRPAQKAIAVRG